MTRCKLKTILKRQFRKLTALNKFTSEQPGFRSMQYQVFFSLPDCRMRPKESQNVWALTINRKQREDVNAIPCSVDRYIHTLYPSWCGA